MRVPWSLNVKGGLGEEVDGEVEGNLRGSERGRGSYAKSHGLDDCTACLYNENKRWFDVHMLNC